MTIKAILFDLDDSLLHTSWSGKRRVRLAYKCLAAHHPNLTWREFKAAVTTIEPAHGFWQGIAPALKDLGLEHSPASEEAIGFWTYASCPELLRPSPFVRTTLRKLSRSFRFGVVTNGDGAVQRRKFDGLHLAEDFHAFIASEDVGSKKPEPEIFRAALIALSAEPQATVFVGDSLDADIAGAQNAGMKAIWYNPSSLEPGTHVTPDATIQRFSGLPGVICRIAGGSSLR